MHSGCILNIPKKYKQDQNFLSAFLVVAITH